MGLGRGRVPGRSAGWVGGCFLAFVAFCEPLWLLAVVCCCLGFLQQSSLNKPSTNPIPNLNPP